MKDIILCIITNFFRIYLIVKFIQIFLGQSKLNRLNKIWVFVFFTVNTSLYLIFHLSWINIICNLIGVSLLVLMYTNSIKMLFYMTFAINALNICCDNIAVRFFVEYREGEPFSQLCVIITDLLFLICVIVTDKIVKNRKDMDNYLETKLIFVPLCSIFIVWFMIIINSKPDIGIIITSIGLLIINFFVFYLYDMQASNMTQKYENEFLKHKMLTYTNQINIILNTEDKVRTLKHDLKHHINELQILANKKDIYAIQKYLHNMNDYIENPDEVISSGDFEVDSLLNYMLRKAQNEHLLVNTKIVLPKEVCKTFDITAILGNLLDNAIEAARQTTDKILNISISLKQGVLRIEIENSYNGPLINDEKNIATTKNNKNDHGIGLNSVKQIVEKQNGILKVYTRDNLFCIRLILYIPET